MGKTGVMITPHFQKVLERIVDFITGHTHKDHSCRHIPGVLGFISLSSCYLTLAKRVLCLVQNRNQTCTSCKANFKAITEKKQSRLTTPETSSTKEPSRVHFEMEYQFLL
jgi:hypothetical protein